MKKILKILFAFLVPVWFAFSCAHAEDYGEEINITSSDVSMNLYGFYNAGSNYSGAFSGSTVYERSNLRSLVYQAGSGWDNAFQCAQTYQQNSTRLPLSDLSFPSVNYGNANTINISEVGFSVDYDLPALNGWYTCTYDIYLGVGVFYPRNGTASYCVNSFTVDGSADFYTDSGGHPFIIQYLDTVQSTFTIGNNTQRFDLLHFQAIYQGDHVEETLSLGLYDYIHSHISGWQASGVYGNGYDIAAYTFQAFVDFHVYYQNEPPVTPTPTPTPSPNQDIINNNNTNTTNIISTINDGFDGLSAIFEGAIYGLTDLFFGSASDWIDFFSDVQDDMEEYLPVVTFFQSCKNILANFFNVESTDPTALQFVAGWQSDIYTLHIGALPLVLPEGTYNFFPEVNFDLNNPFMNEIRPYWLTFSNVLITLLFLRYLANYLFRWTQLLTGDTSVAFQLFHQAPDELENLGTDPYDLAGDYSYDSIDSANHDLYQDAEAHYGHGAARYLSKVFHSK